MKIISIKEKYSKILFLVAVFISVHSMVFAQGSEYCAICSREAWEGDSVALNKFIKGCGVIDTVQYDSLNRPAKSQQAYQTITLKLNDGKVMFRDSIYFVVDEMPGFNGGDKELIRYLSANIQYPPAKKDAGGTVYISFIIEKDGRVKYAKVMRGIGEEFNAEALRVIKNMPAWKPGKKLGNPVRCK